MIGIWPNLIGGGVYQHGQLRRCECMCHSRRQSFVLIRLRVSDAASDDDEHEQRMPAAGYHNSRPYSFRQINKHPCRLIRDMAHVSLKTLPFAILVVASARLELRCRNELAS